MITRPAAVLLDMDGTLVDSHPAVEAAWRAWAVENDLDPAEVIAFCHGQAASATIRRFRPDLSDEDVERACRRQLDRECDDLDGVVLAEGAGRLLARLDELSIPWAIVTNSPGRLAAGRLAATGLTPPVLVTFDDVAEGKPAPDGYLLAARLVGVDPSEAWAVEDSASGLAAAQAAGTSTIGLRGLPGSDLDCDGLLDVLAALDDAHRRNA